MGNQDIITRLRSIELNASNVMNEANRLRRELEKGTPVPPKRVTELQIKARADRNKALRKKLFP